MPRYNYYAERIIPLLIEQEMILEEQKEDFAEYIRECSSEEES